MDASAVSFLTAAAGAADPSDPEYQTKVAGAALDLAALASSGIGEVLAKFAAAKTFPATVVGVSKEASSTRGVVMLRTRPSERYKDGIEPSRTERTDGSAGRAVARKAVGLIGHKVLVFLVVEKMDGGNSVRVVINLLDQGPAPDKAEIVAAYNATHGR